MDSFSHMLDIGETYGILLLTQEGNMDLKYSVANAKTEALAKVPQLRKFLEEDSVNGLGRRRIFSLDLLSGFSCPYAKECLSKVVVTLGKCTIKDGPDTQFRCFSATQELIYRNTYNRRKANFDSLRSLKTANEMFWALNDMMPKNLGICRIHVAGDMFNANYLKAWMMMADLHPDRLFYAYTKSLPFWVSERKDIAKLPNFVLTASRGGKHDALIGRYRLRSARVVFSVAEAKKFKLAIDHDDSHAADPTKKKESFALLLHGVQPKGSEASKALSALKGKGSYSRNKKS